MRIQTYLVIGAVCLGCTNGESGAAGNSSPQAGASAVGGGPGSGGMGAAGSAAGGGDTGGSAGAIASGGSSAAGGAEPAGSYWHIESPADSERTWFVSPTGERTFLLGVNTVMRDKSCDGALDYIRRLPPSESANVEWARLSDGESNGQTAPKSMCFNSVGAFSDTNDFDDSGGESFMVRPSAVGGAEAPYSVVLYLAPAGVDRALRNAQGEVLESGVAGVRIGDPFNPAFLADLDARMAEDVYPRRFNENLVAWHAGNELGIFDAAGKAKGVRDFRRWIWTACPAGSSLANPQCAPHAFAAHLQESYGSLSALNSAWETSYGGADMLAVVSGESKPIPYEPGCNLTCRSDLQRFVHDKLLRAWVVAVTTRIRAADPNHLVGSPRLALTRNDSYRFWSPAAESLADVWADTPEVKLPNSSGNVRYDPLDLLARDGAAGFDFINLNVYTGSTEFASPWFADGVHRLQQETGLPTYVSEFSVRARIDGWSNKGGAFAFVPQNDGVEDQLQRGARYRTQMQQLVGFRKMLGASWHAWSDRYLAADDSQQINMGLVQCDDPVRNFTAGARWVETVDRVREWNCEHMAHIAEATGL